MYREKEEEGLCKVFDVLNCFSRHAVEICMGLRRSVDEEGGRGGMLPLKIL